MQIAQTFQNLDENPFGFLLFQGSLLLDKLAQLSSMNQFEHLVDRVRKLVLEQLDSTHDILVVEPLENPKFFLVRIQLLLIVWAGIFYRKTTHILEKTV